MANLQDALEERCKARAGNAPMPAARCETLKPEAYLEECEGKPMHPVLLGLRTPNDEDYSTAISKGTDHDAMITIVSVGICDPNDCRKRHPSFPYPDVQVPTHLKPETIRYLFDRIERLHIETSPTVALATDEELFLLGSVLQDGERLDKMAADNLAAANRIRRLATAIIESLGIDDA